ncbi:EF-hand domain-containing protein [Peteryoungia desertarenae]|uniref:EF-hand domain-containing protein n=1 Tax=Peteryoungia desertarenae TaxID=1813451 RepID=A0ABX6QKW3_9HYPH|nr:EF-hand domain-containing protein [Peteryoungia desertarenae]QLF69233.1 EF-hand domain-containing protein [Peteryoungia desertarenae]
MKAKSLTLTAMVGTLLVGTSAATAFAQQGPGGFRAPEIMFVQLLQKHDADKDGKISKSESASAVDVIFTEVDTDSDGALTPGEFRAYREKMRDERRAAMAEMREQAGNGGKMEGREHAGKHGGRHEGKGMEMRADRGGPDGKRGGPRGMMRAADTDENGQISKVEATAVADNMFERMDRNSDGFISSEDMPQRRMMMP